MTSPLIFDRKILTAHRQRAAAIGVSDADFLWRECADQLQDKLSDINRTFPHTLDLGCHHGGLRPLLQNRFGIETIIQCDLSSEMLKSAIAPKLLADPEWLPFAENSFDLIVSIGSLHWVNDLPGCLAQIIRALKPDGMFIGMLAGGETLIELRSAMYEAMQQTTGGLSPRLSPMIDVPDAGGLLQRAGFALPVVDRVQHHIAYSSPIKLLHDLRAMGQTSALLQRADKPLTRSTLAAMNAAYSHHFLHPEGGVSATFDIITLTGWKPEKSRYDPM